MDNQLIESRLEFLVQQGKVGHLWLFSGSSFSKKEEIALKFAQELLKTNKPSHPDLYRYYPEGKLALHTLGSMKDLCEQIYLAPYEAFKKVFLIYHADRMLPNSANSLLKTLEEPPQHAVIILLTEHPENVIETLVSRARRLIFPDNMPSLSIDLPLFEKLNKLLQQLENDFPEFSILEKIDNLIQRELQALEKNIYENEAQQIGELTAIQKESIEKKVHGLIALSLQEKIESILMFIFAWYRDQYLRTTTEGKFAILSEIPAVSENKQENRKFLLFMDKLEKLLSQARLAHQRSLKLPVLLESLLIQIKQIA